MTTSQVKRWETRTIDHAGLLDITESSRLDNVADMESLDGLVLFVVEHGSAQGWVSISRHRNDGWRRALLCSIDLPPSLPLLTTKVEH